MKRPAGVEVLFARVGGLDVHKKLILACRRLVQADGRITREVRRFGTMTADLSKLREWLLEAGVTHVAMESTGVLWRPVFNMLEGHLEVWLINAQHIKRVPGRKTDVRDAEWIAQLLQCGLVRPSFVPARAQRELRDLTRHRTKLVQQRTAVANRLQDVLEDANLKLGVVASDVLGASGRAMLEAIIAGDDDPQRLAELAQRQLRAKIPQLQQALHGRVTAHHRFMLRELLEQYDALEQAIARVSARLEEVLPRPFHEAAEQLDAIPGVARRAALAIASELGTDMRRFPTHKHLASWAGRCPGNHESAGKHQSGKTRPGNRWLDGVLTEVAHAAVRTQGTYFQAQYHHLAPRRGKKRAIGAVKHSLLTTIYFMLRDGRPYQDLGAEHFNRLNPAQRIRYHLRKLRELGQNVQIAPLENAA
ncbi:MAG TPA: IS110 family transposase [Steroidobacteraceae bacterium]|nr:IS110 family transposase [Steroidobacteraceae bacterium]